MASDSERHNPHLIYAQTEFLNENHILHYLNKVLVPFLQKNEIVQNYIHQNIKFMIQLLPINVEDIIIMNENNKAERHEYTTITAVDMLNDFVSTDLATDHEKRDKLLLPSNNFHQRKFISDIRSYLNPQKPPYKKYKKISGKTFIYCNDKNIINLLLKRDLEGNPNYVRKFNLNPEGILYSEKDVENYRETNGFISVMNRFEIDFDYKITMCSYADYFNYEETNNDLSLLRSNLCEIFSNFVTSMESLSKTDELPNFEIDLSPLWSQYKIRHATLEELRNLYAIRLRKNRFLAENGIFFSKLRQQLSLSLIDEKSRKILKNEVTFLNIENLKEQRIGIFYLQDHYTTSSPQDLFMRQIIQYVNNVKLLHPAFPNNFYLDSNLFVTLIYKLFGKQIDMKSLPYSQYVKLSYQYKIKVETRNNEINSYIDNIYGSLDLKYLVDIPSYVLDESEIEIKNKILRNIISLKTTAIEEGKKEDLEMYEKITEMVENSENDHILDIYFTEYRSDLTSKIYGSLEYDITNTRIKINEREEHCETLINSVDGRIKLTNFFKPFFNMFVTPDKDNNVVITFSKNSFIVRGKSVDQPTLIVTFSSENDAFDCTKFRTRFSINPKNEDTDESKYYILTWKKTKEQLEFLTGKDNEKTKKLYTKSAALKLGYPFTDNSYLNFLKIAKQHFFEDYTRNLQIRTSFTPTTNFLTSRFEEKKSKEENMIGEPTENVRKQLEFSQALYAKYAPTPRSVSVQPEIRSQDARKIPNRDYHFNRPLSVNTHKYYENRFTSQQVRVQNFLPPSYLNALKVDDGYIPSMRDNEGYTKVLSREDKKKCRQSTPSRYEDPSNRRNETPTKKYFQDERKNLRSPSNRYAQDERKNLRSPSNRYAQDFNVSRSRSPYQRSSYQNSPAAREKSSYQNSPAAREKSSYQNSPAARERSSYQNSPAARERSSYQNETIQHRKNWKTWNTTIVAKSLPSKLPEGRNSKKRSTSSFSEKFPSHEDTEKIIPISENNFLEDTDRENSYLLLHQESNVLDAFDEIIEAEKINKPSLNKTVEESSDDEVVVPQISSKTAVMKTDTLEYEEISDDEVVVPQISSKTAVMKTDTLEYEEVSDDELVVPQNSSKISTTKTDTLEYDEESDDEN
jgi:hypothetical protein